MATLDRVQEFPPDQAPFQEFVNIDTMLKSGVKVDQIVALGSTGNLPVLTAPETQKALVRIVEDHGSRAIVREVKMIISRIECSIDNKFRYCLDYRERSR
jgi:hypothetical protein